MVEGKFQGWDGDISVVYFQEEWTNSIAPGHSLSDPCGFLFLSTLFFPPAALGSYIRLFLSFRLPPPLSLSRSHTHTRTHKANICTVAWSVLWWITPRDGQLLHQGSVRCEPKPTQRSAERARIKQRWRVRERFHSQVDTKWVSNENLWTSSHCHPQTVISVICYYQRFSRHWFPSSFSDKRKIVACSPLLLLLSLCHLFSLRCALCVVAHWSALCN